MTSSSSLPYYSTSDQIHYAVRPYTRYCVTAVYVFVITISLVISFLSRVIPLIVVSCIMGTIFLPYILYLGVYTKIKVTSEGLYVWGFNPFQPSMIPWSSIQKVSFGSYSSYQVIGTDGKYKASFRVSIQRFDQLIQAFRNRKIPIEERSQQLPDISANASATGSQHDPLLSGVRKVRSIASPFAGLYLAFMLLIVSLALFVLTFAVFWPSAVGIIFGLFDSIALFICSVVILQSVFNGFINIRSDGAEFPKFFAAKRFVAWSDIHYTRIVQVFTRRGAHQFAVIYIRGQEDFFHEISAQAEAFLPLLSEMKSHNIPVLKETEELKT